MNKTLSRLTTAGLVLASALTALAPLTASAIAVVPAPPTATTVTVYPAAPHGWGFFNDATGGTGSGSFVNGPSTPPLGTGSAQLTVDSTARWGLGTTQLSGTKLSDISSMKYSTYSQTSTTTLAPSLQFDVDYSSTDAVTTYQGRLVYEPYVNGSVASATWQQWDTTVGKWWSSPSANTTSDDLCPQAAPCTWTAIKTAFPTASLRTNNALLFKVGGPWAGGFTGNVDSFVIGIGANTTTYNFENAIPTVSTPTITSPANGAVLTTSQLTKIDWTDSTATGNGPVKYQYQAYSNANYTGLIYDSGATLTASEIPTTGTPEGVYYVRVTAYDNDGNASTPSNGPANPYKITVKNSPTTFSQCLGTGYQVFSNPAFPNQTSCVLYVARQIINSYRPYFNFNFSF